MYAQYSLSTLTVGQCHTYLTVKTPRPQERRIEHIRPICSRHYNNLLSLIKAVHLYQQLVERLLPLIIDGAETRPPSAPHSIQLINKDDRRRSHFSQIKKVSHSARPHTDKHLYEF